MKRLLQKFVTILSLFFLLLSLLLPIPPAVGSEQPDPAAEWGDLSGQFRYTGTPPAPQKNKRFQDHSLIIGENGGIKNICVYWNETSPLKLKIHPEYLELPKTVVLKFRNSTIEPHVSGLWQARQQLIIRNQDADWHQPHIFPFKNLFPEPTPLAPRSKKSVDFSKSEKLPVQIKCDIHPW